MATCVARWRRPALRADRFANHWRTDGRTANPTGISCSSLAALAANRAALASLVEDILVAPFDAQAAMAYGPLRAAHKDCNRDALDKLIASHVVALGVTLATNNEADFASYDAEDKVIVGRVQDIDDII
jgi:predicted nucleic acid-binding protein